MMREREQLDLALAVLDQELVDWEGSRCGRVDDVELEGGPGGALRVRALVVGPAAWSARAGVLGRLAGFFYPGREVLVPWSEIEDITQVVKLRSLHSQLGLGTGDDRARRWLRRLPGS